MREGMRVPNNKALQIGRQETPFTISFHEGQPPEEVGRFRYDPERKCFTFEGDVDASAEAFVKYFESIGFERVDPAPPLGNEDGEER